MAVRKKTRAKVAAKKVPKSRARTQTRARKSTTTSSLTGVAGTKQAAARADRTPPQLKPYLWKKGQKKPTAKPAYAFSRYWKRRLDMPLSDFMIDSLQRVYGKQRMKLFGEGLYTLPCGMILAELRLDDALQGGLESFRDIASRLDPIPSRVELSTDEPLRERASSFDDLDQTQASDAYQSLLKSGDDH